jgi:predicted anti-sigma-YlaC factor YlaD
MQCDVAREALSARIDGEREPVPAARVDEHLQTCPDCRSWYIFADEQARTLRIREGGPGRDRSEEILAAAGVERVGRYRRWARWSGRYWVRCALVAVGLVQVAVAAAQMGGVDFGMLSTAARQPGVLSGEHLMNETTAWSLALGLGMVVAGARPVAAAGVACVLGVFAAVLAWYVIDDSMAGQVTGIRVLSHLPVLAGVMLAAMVYRQDRRERRTPPAASADDIVLPGNATRGRRRGHLFPSTDSAA